MPEKHSNSHIRLSDYSKVYTHKPKTNVAFENLNLTIDRGEFVAIIGPSGCGKTSLLRCIAGLEEATHGELSFTTNTSDDAIAMIFQEHGLFPWMSLEKNIQIILQNNPRIQKQNIPEISRHFLEKVGLESYADFLPHQVSGGMKQRVSIARSFASDPDILLMDEPFVFLDFQTRLLLHELLIDIWRDSGKTIIFVTHDIDEAILLSDRIIVLSGHPGHIVANKKITLNRPRDLLTTRKSPVFQSLLEEIIGLIRDEICL